METIKIVINIGYSYSGFRLSDVAVERLAELCGVPGTDFDYYDVSRDNPALIQVVEELGDEACGNLAVLKIVEIPVGVEWKIHNYDGQEWVAEKHRTWS